MNQQAQKVVVVAYRRWSFTTGSTYNALTEKILVFWIGGRIIMGGGRRQEVVALMEVRLYTYISSRIFEYASAK